MPNARVGAMPQPNNYQNKYPPGRGTWRNRGQQGGGLSIEDLKRQTALRLAQEGGENSDTAVKSEYDPSYQRHHPSQHRYNPPSHYPSNSNARPQYNMAPNANQYSQPQDYAQHHATNYYPQNYSHSHQEQHVSRNYTDSQLGLGGRGGGGGAAARGGQPPQQYPSVRSPSHQHQHQQQQQYSTPRVPSHELALKDRGSAENSDASEGGYNIVSKGSTSSSSSHHRHEDRNAKQFKARGIQSPDGRRTPVRDGNVQGQKIIFSPHRQIDHQRDHASTPTSAYSEPPRDRSNPNSPHNMQQQRGGGRRPQNHLGYHRCRNEPPPPNSNRYGPQQPQQQSKLPHGLTVQELKEMTRARLAADAEAAEVSSVHSGGTHGSSNNGSIYANVIPSHSSDQLTRNLVQTNDSIRHTQSYGAKPVQHQYQQHPQQQQQQQRQFQQYPNNARYPSPVFDAAAPSQFNGAMQSPRRISPLSDFQGPDAGMLNTANGGNGGTNAPFSPPPISWASGEASAMMNRSRCHSAEANLSPLRSVGGSVNVSMSMEGNRRRCLTTSPLAQMTRMDRVSEDKPFWFDDDEKDRLAIPQLGLRSSLNSAPPTFSDSAFQPIGKPRGLSFSDQKPQQLSHADRMVSMESQGHGDLPSSMAEAVLNSLTGAPQGVSAIGGDVIGSPFRPVKNHSDTVGDLRFRTLSDNLLSASASGSELGTLSWGGDTGDEETSNNNLSLSDDFNSLLNIGEPSSLAPLRGRANTDPPHIHRWK